MAEAYQLLSDPTKADVKQILIEKLRTVFSQGMADLYQGWLDFCKSYPCDDNGELPESTSVPVSTTSTLATCPGCFPNFNKNDCYVGWYGFYMCMAEDREYVITRICREYPGESYCTWPEVQESLQVAPK
jgi:hypothetical protein